MEVLTKVAVGIAGQEKTESERKVNLVVSKETTMNPPFGAMREIEKVSVTVLIELISV